MDAEQGSIKRSRDHLTGSDCGQDQLLRVRPGVVPAEGWRLVHQQRELACGGLYAQVLSNLSNISSQHAKATQEATTGVRVGKPSDDPIAAELVTVYVFTTPAASAN